jgi:inosine-uridine nucleoside N-ribohydrolase
MYIVACGMCVTVGDLVIQPVGAGQLLIFDTDFRTDVDDVGALAIVHALQNRGQTNLIGVNTSTASSSVVGAIDAVNSYYGRPDIPISVVTPGLATGGADKYTPTLANKNLFPSNQTTATAQNSTNLYRSLLNSATTKSVTIVVVGGQNAILDLMQSGANYNHDGINLSGLQLIQDKVSELVVMGGNFTDPTDKEYNNLQGVAAAQQVAAQWPTPIVYSGWEIGNGVNAGAALSSPQLNPVAKAYELYFNGAIKNRATWDQTAVLYAAVGVSYQNQTLWNLSGPQEISFANDGRTLATPSATANRYFLIKKMPNSALASIISSLMTAPTAVPEPCAALPVK